MCHCTKRDYKRSQLLSFPHFCRILKRVSQSSLEGMSLTLVPWCQSWSTSTPLESVERLSSVEETQMSHSIPRPLWWVDAWSPWNLLAITWQSLIPSGMASKELPKRQCPRSISCQASPLTSTGGWDAMPAMERRCLSVTWFLNPCQVAMFNLGGTYMTLKRTKMLSTAVPLSKP